VIVSPRLPHDDWTPADIARARNIAGHKIEQFGRVVAASDALAETLIDAEVLVRVSGPAEAARAFYQLADRLAVEDGAGLADTAARITNSVSSRSRGSRSSPLVWRLRVSSRVDDHAVGFVAGFVVAVIFCGWLARVW
jgi:hypothetical protein